MAQQWVENEWSDKDFWIEGFHLRVYVVVKQKVAKCERKMMYLMACPLTMVNIYHPSDDIG